MDGNREEVLQLILNNFTFLFLISRVQADNANNYLHPVTFFQKKMLNTQVNKIACTIKMRR